MATAMERVVQTSQSLSGKAVDVARSLPSEVPRQAVKGVNYLLGRGAIAMVLGVCAFTFKEAIWPAIFIGVPLITGFQAFLDYRKEQNAKHHLLDEFAEEISQVLGKDGKDLTLKDLETVINGDRHKGIPPNSVLKEEWDRIGRKRSMQFATTAMAGVAALVAILAPIFPADAVGVANEVANNGMTNIAHMAGVWVTNVKEFILSITPLSSETGIGMWLARGFTYTGITMSAGIIIGGVNNALDFVGGHILGISGKTTHDLIDDISHSLNNGKLVTKEQVLGVYVSANTDLAQDIKEYFGKSFEKLGWQKQQAAVAIFGKEYDIHTITQDINFGVVKPQELAFSSIGQKSGVAAKDQYADALDSHEQEVAKAKAKEAEKQAKREPKETEEQKSFVERFAPDHSRESAQSFLDRISQQDLQAAELVHSRS